MSDLISFFVSPFLLVPSTVSLVELSSQFQRTDCYCGLDASAVKELGRTDAISEVKTPPFS